MTQNILLSVTEYEVAGYYLVREVLANLEKRKPLSSSTAPDPVVLQKNQDRRATRLEKAWRQWLLLQPQGPKFNVTLDDTDAVMIKELSKPSPLWQTEALLQAQKTSLFKSVLTPCIEKAAGQIEKLEKEENKKNQPDIGKRVEIIEQMVTQAKAAMKSHFLEMLKLECSWVLRPTQQKIHPISFLRSTSVDMDMRWANMSVAMPVNAARGKPAVQLSNVQLSKADPLEMISGLLDTPENRQTYQERYAPVLDALRQHAMQSIPDAERNALTEAVAWLHPAADEPRQVDTHHEIPHAPLALVIQAMTSAVVSAPFADAPDAMGNVIRLTHTPRDDRDDTTGFFFVDEREPDLTLGRVLQKLWIHRESDSVWQETQKPEETDPAQPGGWDSPDFRSTILEKPELLHELEPDLARKVLVKSGPHDQPDQPAPLKTIEAATKSLCEQFLKEIRRTPRPDLQEVGYLAHREQLSGDIFSDQDRAVALSHFLQFAAEEFQKQSGTTKPEHIRWVLQFATFFLKDSEDEDLRWYTTALDGQPLSFFRDKLTELVISMIQRQTLEKGAAAEMTLWQPSEMDGGPEYGKVWRRIERYVIKAMNDSLADLSWIELQEDNPLVAQGAEESTPAEWTMMVSFLQKGEHENLFWRAVRAWVLPVADTADLPEQIERLWQVSFLISCATPNTHLEGIRMFNDGPEDLREWVLGLVNQHLFASPEHKATYKPMTQKANGVAAFCNSHDGLNVPIKNNKPSLLQNLLYRSCEQISRSGPNAIRHAKLTQALPEDTLPDWIRNKVANLLERLSMHQERGTPYDPTSLFRRYPLGENMDQEIPFSTRPKEQAAWVKEAFQIIKELYFHPVRQIAQEAEEIIKILSCQQALLQPLINPLLTEILEHPPTPRTQEINDRALTSKVYYESPIGRLYLNPLSYGAEDKIIVSNETIKLLATVDARRGFQSAYSAVLFGDGEKPPIDIETLVTFALDSSGFYRNHIRNTKQAQTYFSKINDLIKNDADYAYV